MTEDEDFFVEMGSPREFPNTLSSDTLSGPFGCGSMVGLASFLSSMISPGGLENEWN